MLEYLIETLTENTTPMTVLVVLYLVIAAVFWSLDFGYKKKVFRKRGEPHFFGETESVEDLLEQEEKAKHFSAAALNNFNEESLVVGLEGEWGSGKSSFINKCEEFWQQEDVKVINFSAFACHKDNFLECFVEVFSSELHSSLGISRKKITSFFLNQEASWRLSFFGALEITGNLPKITSVFNKEKLDKKELEQALGEKLGRLIIVIDDLDRMSLDQIREVARIVRYAANFKYTTFVLCYDVSNLNSNVEELKKREAQERISGTMSSGGGASLTEVALKIDSNQSEDFDNKNIVRFMEKIINVKYVLVSGRDEIDSYTQKLLEKHDSEKNE